LSAISFYKNTLQLSAAAGKAPARWKPHFEVLCRDYERAVKATGRIDFDDMLCECRELLQKDSAAREYWQGRFRHILMDEFQDINPIQYEVVKLLSASPHNLFAVGDDDQAIYSFRGAEPDCLHRFVREYGARQLLLEINYRSKAEIVRASLAVIEENKNRFTKQLRAAQPQGCQQRVEAVSPCLSVQDAYGTDLQRPLVLRELPDREAQYQWILMELSQPSRPEESRAVLFRTNSYMQGFAARLQAANIPYEMREKVSSIYEHFIVADLRAYLQVAQGKGSREQMLRIMNRPSRFISREALGDGRIEISRMQAYYQRAQMPESQKRRVREALSKLEGQLQKLRDLSPLPAVSYLLKAVGYEQYLKELSRGRPEKWQEWQELLIWLKEDAAGFASTGEWIAFQEKYTKALEQGGVQKARRPGQKDRREALQKSQSPSTKGQKEGENLPQKPVQLLTVHGAKGLEFDRVWIPDCNERIFPHGRMPDERNVEEERRIFYVAMTRAKKNLELLYITGTKERPREPSRFLKPLLESMDYSISSSNSQLSRYSSKASVTFSYSSSSSI